jgi:hypothetical protein
VAVITLCGFAVASLNRSFHHFDSRGARKVLLGMVFYFFFLPLFGGLSNLWEVIALARILVGDE